MAATVHSQIDEAEFARPSNLIDSTVIPLSRVKTGNKITILSFNARSINNKFDKIRYLVNTVDPTFFLVQETWGKNAQTDYSVHSYQKPEFKVRESDKMNAGGGVAVWIKVGIQFTRLDSPFIEKVIETITIKSDSPNLLIINAYCPLMDKETFIIRLNEHIEALIKSYPNYGIIVAGDFNMNLSQPCTYTELLTELMTEAGMLQQVTSPTRVSDTTETIIDHVYTKLTSNSTTDIILSDISDHFPTLTSIIGRTKLRKNITVTKRWLNNNSYESIKQVIEDTQWDLNPSQDLDTKVETFHTSLSEIIDNIAPVLSKKINRNQLNTWTTQGLRISMRKSAELYSKSKKNPRVKDEYKKYKRILDRTIHAAKNMVYRKSLTAAGSDTRKVWGVINEVIDRKQLRHEIPRSFSQDNDKLTTDIEISNGFNKYFANIGKEMADSIQDTPGYEMYLPRPPTYKFHLQCVTSEQVKNIMKKQQPKLSAGIDIINNKIVKQNAEALAQKMTEIINQSITQKRVPALYKKALIKPLFKKGDHDIFGNYRPVSLLPSLSKILEKVVNRQTVNYLEENHLLCDNQFGFRPKNQTTHVVHKLLNIISSAAAEKEVCIATYIDLSKAFDCLQYDKLFTKMTSLGFANETVQWYKDYLKDRQQCVEVNDTRSTWENVKLGVPQGSILGPTLFLIYINDINKCDDESHFIKFADDTTIITQGSTEKEAADKMNITLEKVSNWFKRNKLNLNPSKTRYQIFNCKTEKEDHLVIGGEKIQRAWAGGKEKTFKLVGIHIDERLTWAGHIDHIAKKINSSLYGLVKARRSLDTKNKTLLYSGLIHSHITYGLPIWGHATKGRLQILLTKQKKALRQIHNLKYRDHTLPYFIKSKILQLPELINHATLTYIHSGTHQSSPSNVKSLWKVKHQTRQDLRYRGLTLEIPVSNIALVNHLPVATHPRLWNGNQIDCKEKQLSIAAFKHKSKMEQLYGYLDILTPEEEDIINQLDLELEEIMEVDDEVDNGCQDGDEMANG